MLDFRRHHRATKNPGPALERRMLAALVGLGIVVLLLAGPGNRRAWQWLEPGNATAEHRPAARQQVVVAMARESDDNDDARQRSEQLFPGVRSDYLATVRDDTTFRPVESDSWFNLFSVLERTPDAELAAASEGPAAYVQLDQQPNEYRGRLISVGGIVRAAKRVTAPQNVVGIKHYYQLWLQPNTDTEDLIVLYCLELPAEFPLGNQLDARATVTGFFFKRWAYQSRGGIATAPLVMARTLDWQPPLVSAPAPARPLSEQLLTAVAVALVLAIVVLVFLARRGQGRAQTAGAAPHDATGEQIAAAISDLESRQPTESH